jgi:hypothetical protein
MRGAEPLAVSQEGGRSPPVQMVASTSSRSQPSATRSQPTAARAAARFFGRDERSIAPALVQPSLEVTLGGCVRRAVLDEHHVRLRRPRQRRGDGGVDRTQERGERRPVVDEPDARREPDVKVGAEAEARAERLDHHVRRPVQLVVGHNKRVEQAELARRHVQPAVRARPEDELVRRELVALVAEGAVDGMAE